MHIRCSRCRDVLHQNRFPTVKGYRLSYCKACRMVRKVERQNSSLAMFLKVRLQLIKNRSGNTGREFDLKVEDLVYLYEKQEGRCFYTDEKLIVEAGNGKQLHGLSVDRLNIKRGYVLENIVLCTNKANTVKSNLTLDEIRKWLPSWWERMKPLLEDQQYEHI
jgi:CRISPR/Cas system Type II protein with McrA/HNH and RuvC-like nuclease domain